MISRPTTTARYNVYGMTTQAQITANRQNGRKSKGPKTAHGKAISAANSRKHGLLSRDVVGPTEDPADFRDFHERLHAELDPVGELEEDLVSRITAQAWRLRRVEKVDAGLYTVHYCRVLENRAEQKADPTMRAQRIADTIDSLRPLRESETAMLGAAFIQDACWNTNAFTKLIRYEAAIERSLHRNLHELQRLQAARKAHAVAPPAAIDISAGNRASGTTPEDLTASEERGVTKAA